MSLKELVCRFTKHPPSPSPPQKKDDWLKLAGEYAYNGIKVRYFLANTNFLKRHELLQSRAS